MSSRKGKYVATNLSDVMRMQGRSLGWLGERLGVHRSYVSHIAARRKRASDELARGCSEALGVPLALLFEDTEDAATRRYPPA